MNLNVGKKNSSASQLRFRLNIRLRLHLLPFLIRYTLHRIVDQIPLSIHLAKPPDHMEIALIMTNSLSNNSSKVVYLSRKLSRTIIKWTMSVPCLLSMTVSWYLANAEWLENVTSGNYQKYYEKHYR